MRPRLWRARSGSANPVARSAMTLGSRTEPPRPLLGPPTESPGRADPATTEPPRPLPGPPTQPPGRAGPALRQPEDRLQRVALAQPGVVTAVEELERLDEELDLADPATSELDVRRRVALLAERPIDLRLHRADRGEDPRVEARPVDDLARQLHEACPHAGVAGGHARLDERLTLPQLGALPIVVAVPVEREDDGAHPPLGPQAQVDAERVALVGDLFEKGHELPAHTREVVAVHDAAAAPARRLTVGPVDEHKVDVGRVVELPAAELPHRDDGHTGRGPGRIARRAGRSARRRPRRRERPGEG